MSNQKKIYVTSPALPPFEEFIPMLTEIWNSRNLTNNKSFHQRFEKDLANYLDVPYVSLFCNATLGLWASLVASGAKGDVITSPFTFPQRYTQSSWQD